MKSIIDDRSGPAVDESSGRRTIGWAGATDNFKTLQRTEKNGGSDCTEPDD
jgi:phage FluMu gp28-like protein